MEDQFFARIPYDLFDARRQNVITSIQFDIMVLLHRWANWHTGIVRTCSAERLQAAMGDLEKPPSVRTIQRHVQGLHEAGWVFSHYRKGSKKPYPVDINNFMPVADKDGEVTVIRPTVLKDWEETGACRVADEGATGDGKGTVKGRSKGGLKETVPKISDKTSHETSFKETSSNEVSEVSEEGSVASLPPSASSTSPDEQETLVKSQEEVSNLSCILEAKCDLRPTREVMDSVFKSHPDFYWGSDALQVVSKRISAGGWKRSIVTPSDFAHYWESKGPTSLYAQVMRDMPTVWQGEVDDEPESRLLPEHLQEEIDVPATRGKKMFEMEIEEEDGFTVKTSVHNGVLYRDCCGQSLPINHKDWWAKHDLTCPERKKMAKPFLAEMMEEA